MELEKGISAKGRFVSLQTIPWKLDGDAFVLPVSGFPLGADEVAAVARFLDTLTAIASDGLRLSSEVFIQLTQFRGGKKRFADHSSKWEPALGLGVWPDRPPPTLWTRDDFVNLGHGENPRPLMYQVLRVSAPPTARHNARSVMLDLGSVLQIMTASDSGAFFQAARELLLPPIVEPSFRIFRFYIPLLEGKSLQNATPGQLEAWFCGATVYIRESFEDKGILIASKEPLAPILKELGGEPQQEPERGWVIPG